VNASLDGANPNPFYDSGVTDFNYAYWKANAGVAFADAHLVILEAGGVDVGALTNDAAAVSAATNYAATAEFIITSIRAANPTTAIAIQTMAPGPLWAVDLSAIYGGATWRQRRNWKILNAKQTSQFGGREGSGIYVIPAGSSIDPVTGWPKALQPRNRAITRDMTTYATYAAMVADLTKGGGSIAYATDAAAYFVKVGPTGGGRWREAEERDGFINRLSGDGIHPGAIGAIQTAEAVWALLKVLN
jgi:lysophospholipase L1-like esterase